MKSPLLSKSWKQTHASVLHPESAQLVDAIAILLVCGGYIFAAGMFEKPG
jgi:hypothetical protein